MGVGASCIEAEDSAADHHPSLGSLSGDEVSQSSNHSHNSQRAHQQQQQQQQHRPSVRGGQTENIVTDSSNTPSRAGRLQHPRALEIPVGELINEDERRMSDEKLKSSKGEENVEYILQRYREGVSIDVSIYDPVLLTSAGHGQSTESYTTLREDAQLSSVISSRLDDLVAIKGIRGQQGTSFRVSPRNVSRCPLHQSHASASQLSMSSRTAESLCTSRDRGGPSSEFSSSIGDSPAQRSSLTRTSGCTCRYRSVVIDDAPHQTLDHDKIEEDEGFANSLVLLPKHEESEST